MAQKSIVRLWSSDDAKLNRWRRSKKLCDITVVVGGVQFPAHKIVLAQCSRFFETKFTSKVGDKDATIVGIEYEAITPTLFENVLSLMYAGIRKNDVTKHNAPGLLMAADYLDIQILKDMCSNVIGDRNQVDNDNCIDFLKLGQTYGCSSEAAEKHFGENFLEIVNSPEFASNSIDQVLILLGLDSLNVPEDAVCEAAISWWRKQDQEIKTSSLPKLLQKMRIPLMSSSFQDQTLKPFLLENESGTYLEDLVSYQRMSEDQRASSPLHNVKPRLYQDSKVILALVKTGYGGAKFRTFDGGDGNVVYAGSYCFNTLDLKSRKFAPVLEVPGTNFFDQLKGEFGNYNYESFTITSKEEKVLIFSQDHESKSFEFDLKNGRFTEIINSKEHIKSRVCRMDAGLGMLDNKIYMFGGNNECADPNGIVNIYNPEDGRWKAAKSSMGSARACPGVVTLDGLIYVIGGHKFRDGFKYYGPRESAKSYYDGYHYIDNMEVPVAKAEVYDPVKDSWESLPDMNSPRSAHALTVLDGKIYAVGGYTDKKMKAKAECYDPRLKKWKVIADKKSSLGKNCNAVGYNGLLYVVEWETETWGDYILKEKNEVLKTYDPKTGLWTDLGPIEGPEGFHIQGLCLFHRRHLPSAGTVLVRGEDSEQAASGSSKGKGKGRKRKKTEN